MARNSKCKQKKLTIVFGDIRDHDSVDNALEGCDAVINLAAMISVPYSFKNPQSFVDTNVYDFKFIPVLSKKKKRLRNLFKYHQVKFTAMYYQKEKILRETDILSAESLTPLQR